MFGHMVLAKIAVAALPVLFGITLHEAAHAWVAKLLGDKTAYMLGRVSINPIRHIDAVGTLLVPIVLLLFGGFIFGWAKPVPITWQNLKHPRRDKALVALAGPMANILMAFVWAAFMKLAVVAAQSGQYDTYSHVLEFVYATSQFGIFLNCVLAILNLIPIPPLDGSRVVSALIPPRWDAVYSRLEYYGLWILIFLMLLGVLGFIMRGPVLSLLEMISRTFGL